MDGAALGWFGDKRLADLGGVLLDAVQSKQTLCLHRLAEDRNQARQFNRFLSNRAVSSHEMLVTAGRRTGRSADGPHHRALSGFGDVPGARHTSRRSSARTT